MTTLCFFMILALVSLEERADYRDPLTKLLQKGAKQLIEQAVNLELQDLLKQEFGRRIEGNKQAVVRNAK